MASVFTALPEISKQVDALMGTPEDVKELESVLFPFLKVRDLRQMPSEEELCALAVLLASALSNLSWLRRNNNRGNYLVSLIINGIAKNNRWPRMETLTQQPFKFAASKGFTLYQAIAAGGLPLLPTSVSGSAHKPRHSSSRRGKKPEILAEDLPPVGSHPQVAESSSSGGANLDDTIRLDDAGGSSDLYSSVPPSPLDGMFSGSARPSRRTAKK